MKMMKHFILIAIVVIGLLLVGCAQYEPLPGAEQDDSTAGSAVAYNYPISVTELGEGFTFTRGDSQVIWPAIDVAYTDMNVSDVAGIGYIYGNFDRNYYINPNSDRFARYIGLQTRYKSLNDLVFSAGKSYRFVYIPSDVTIQYTEPTQCQDALDNDGDGLVDLDDPGCTGAADNDEYNDPASDSWTDDFSQDGDAVFGDLGIYISLPDGYQYGSGLGVDMRDSSQFSASFKGGKGVRVEGDLAISGTAYSQTAYTEDLVVAEINPRRDDPVHVKGDLSVDGTICDGLGNCLHSANGTGTSEPNPVSIAYVDPTSCTFIRNDHNNGDAPISSTAREVECARDQIIVGVPHVFCLNQRTVPVATGKGWTSNNAPFSATYSCRGISAQGDVLKIAPYSVHATCCDIVGQEVSGARSSEEHSLEFSDDGTVILDGVQQ